MPHPKNPQASHISGQCNKPFSKPAHALQWQKLAEELNANVEDGLTTAEAKQRLGEHGHNEIGDTGGVNPGKILVQQVANAMTLVLILAMAVSFGIQSWIEGSVIAAVILLNICVGFSQEYQAAKTMISLRSLSSPTATAIRDGNRMSVPTLELVPGDLVEMKTGDTIPADVRIIDGVNFETDEALLTGESAPLRKNADEIFDAKIGPGDRLNIAYSSCTVTKGRATGIVFATGLYTEIGAIAAAIGEKKSKIRPIKRKENGRAGPHQYIQAVLLTVSDVVGHFLGVNVGTPLQKKLSRLAMLLFFTAVVCTVIVLAANGFSDRQEVIIYAVATGLSMMPASLVVVLTITMAAGTKRMVKRHVIVRNLKSLEALGSVTDICSDKTGTLTQGKMVQKKAWIPASGMYTVGETKEPFNPTVGSISLTGDEPRHTGKAKHEKDLTCDELLQNNSALEEYLKVASLANLAHVHLSGNGEWNARGDPTEIAMQVFASRFERNRRTSTVADHPAWKLLAEFSFDSEAKKMSVLYQNQASGNFHVFTKGAVERVVDSCTTYVGVDGKNMAMTDGFRQQILANMESLAELGLRVLALASRQWHEPMEQRSEIERTTIEKNLCFRGLAGLYDPPRPESASSVQQCHEAGIDVHMLTGDHPSTAKAIALQVGILPQKMVELSKDVVDAMVMTATQFDELTDEQVDALPVLPLVIARCAPNTKVRMIEALHRRKRMVAMTGDGVNDSPSLKKADIGIAMGQAGSDVARDASDIILTDDNFASILAAIEEGRRTFDNIQKFVLHLLAQNVSQACILLIGLAIKDGENISVFPLSPVEILWIIMVTSAIPDMGLGFERAAPDIMSRPPQDSSKGIFTAEVLTDMLAYGLWITAVCLANFALVLYGFGSGTLGYRCNESVAEGCADVFGARAACFASMTWLSLLLAWSVVDPRRSFFRMRPGPGRHATQWLRDVRANRFLFWAVAAGLATVFPLLYVPVLNEVVFKHTGVDWQWACVFVGTFVFVLGVEAYKWAKRVFFRHRRRRDGVDAPVASDIESRAFRRYMTESSVGGEEKRL